MVQEDKKENYRIKIGITQGDINGIGYEVILKTLSDVRLIDFFTPIIYGQNRIVGFYKKNLGIEDFNYVQIKNPQQANSKKINIINFIEEEVKIEPGQSTKIAGEASYRALEMAVGDLKAGLLDAIVTAPINKLNIQSANFDFPGHTEYLSSRFDNIEPLMLMVSNNLRIGTLTGHIPLRDVPSAVTTDLIVKKLSVFNKSLKIDFRIPRPKIAVLSLNPHAGDGGVIGNDEIDVISPAIKKANEKDILAFGPFPTDGFFGSGNWIKYDGTLAMYHDQGLTAFKILASDGGVNFTAGLPIVRTSPAHGTAYDICGKNIASPDSFREALFMAMDIVRNRADYQIYKNQED